MTDEEREIVIGRCVNCKKYWTNDKLKKLIELVPSGDGVVRRISLMCLDCYKGIEQGIATKKAKSEEDL